MKNILSGKLYKLAELLELILAIIIAIGVIIGFVGLVEHGIEIYKSGAFNSYDIFKEFLKYILMLVVGVEFILMLLTHSVESTAKLVVFVIARKMLVYGSNMVDMVLGALALAIIFATLKFLIYKKEKKDNKEIKKTQSL